MGGGNGMAATIELPREQWEKALATFSIRNTGRPVRLEVEIPPGEGEPVMAEHRPLLGIDFDRKGSEAPAIEIAVGPVRGAEAANLTHIVHDPTHVWIEQDPAGLGIAVEITSREEGSTRILFNPEQALPR
jgi:hypothetical protein